MFRLPTRLHRMNPLLMTLALSLAVCGGVQAAEPLEYNRDIRPILAEYCFACHGPDSAARKADLRLDLREAAIDAAAIVVGAADESELFARVISDDEELIMPPAETKKSLSARDKELLRRWLDEGAKYQAHWSFIAPLKTSPPQVGEWAKGAIDSFVLAKLTEHKLTPAQPAAPRVLFRRIHLDITGLPPNPEQATAFVDDFAKRGDAALSDWIDRLMATTAWGEHRGRYWLDAARYGDTHGLHFDNYREMWPYRDWVIRAFNRNLPFDQFTVEQLAGDLLPKPTDDQLIATGFQRCNITTNEGGTIDEENLALYAADRVQTFGWVYLGLTTNCSQCHNHKFDAFTMKDYYSLAAFFRNTTQPAKDGNVKDGRSASLVVPSAADRDRWKALPAQIAAAEAKRNSRQESVRGAFKEWLAQAGAEMLSDEVLDKGLIAHLPLDEGAGVAVSNRVGEQALEVVANGKIEWVADGKIGSAPVIREGGNFSLGALGDFEKNQAFSCGAWVRTVADDSNGAILARMDVKAKHRGWDLWQNGRNFAVHVVDSWSDNSFKVTTRRNVVKVGKWQHVFATYDGSGKASGLKLYIDGKLEQVKVDNNTIHAEATIRTDSPLLVGQRSEGQSFAGGAIQDVRLYDREVKAGEVEKITRSVNLRAALLADKKRTPPQRKQLFDFFLNERDEDFPQLQKQVAQLVDERKAIQNRSPITHIQKERPGSPAMAHILMRGAYDKPGDKVAAATPASLHPMAKDSPPNRLGLAKWLIDPANPLTTRVTVNRFWQELFGQGLVTTAEDFGVMGAAPSHPDLLDWLAVDFREHGWDVKRLFKSIMMSATYRQASLVSPVKLRVDRDNVLLSRGPRFRMDAEMVRDYALATSGLLSNEMYGPGVKPYQPVNIWEIVGLPGGDTRNYKQDSGDKLYRRTVYTFWKRMAPPPGLEAFNAPSREFCTVRRERTNTPLQALITLNDPQFVEAARRLAENALKSGNGETDAVLNFIAQQVLNRSLEKREREIVLGGLESLRRHYRGETEQAKKLIAVGETLADASLDPAELAAWTMICNQLLNLDEAINK